jgi:hypothetical protein
MTDKQIAKQNMLQVVIHTLDEQDRLMSLFKQSAPDFYTIANRRRTGWKKRREDCPQIARIKTNLFLWEFV